MKNHFISKIYYSLKVSKRAYVSNYITYEDFDSNCLNIDDKKIISFRNKYIYIITNNKRDYNKLNNSKELKKLLNNYKTILFS